MAPIDGGTGTPPPDSTPDPAAEFALEAQLDRVEIEKEQARRAPDLPWTAWWFHSGSKWYLVVGYLIADVWLLSAAIEYNVLAVGIVGLIVALYAEFLLYRYLYYVPPDEPTRSDGPFRPSFVRPVEYGRWTPEGATLRAGGTVARPETGPDPKEFL